MTRLLVLPVILALGGSAHARGRYLGDEGPGTFKTPSILKRNVTLWSFVYGVYHSWQQAYYDTREMDLILGVLDLRPHLGDPSRKVQAIEAERRRIQTALRRLEAGKRTGLSKLERKLFRIYAGRAGALRGAHKRVGAHVGLRDRFVEGLRRLALYRPYVLEVLRRYRLPEELLALAMTESLFNPKARSHAGAHGVWQFLKATGREYLHINDVVDERRDPIVSTDAAARMLAKNLRRLKRWPLALTGFHYGPNGMVRAAREIGSYDLVQILKRWRSKRFKFASRNYYAGFLAALRVMRNEKDYFPDAELPSPLRFRTMRLPGSAPLSGVTRHCRVALKEIAELNPALSPAALKSRVRLPQGFPLRVPGSVGRRCARRFHKVPGARRHGRAGVRYHRVRPRESFVTLARRYGTTVSRLLALNGLQEPRTLRVGERLRIPGRRGARFTYVPVRLAQAGKTAEARPD